MPDLPEFALARSQHSYLIAPAGYGKTEIIAKAVAQSRVGRQLVLTHTHAGVRALRDRFRKLGVSPGLYHLDTIAGWALTYVQAYPMLSNLFISNPPRDEEWQSAYEAATRLVRFEAINRVIITSYRGLYVDEYQDCTLSQHRMILSLSEILPVRFVGDPLQGIFEFAGPLVDWSVHIPANFERLPDLSIPWRWQSVDSRFASWLNAVRTALWNGCPIDLRLANCDRIKWVIKDQNSHWRTCMGKAGQGGTIVAIHKMPHNAHGLAQKLKGAFTSMEEIYSKDLFKWAQKLDRATGPARAIVLIDFAAKCLTAVSTRLGSIRRALLEGRRFRSTNYPEIARALHEVVAGTDLSPVVRTMGLIENISGAILYRRELWREMMKSIDECQASSLPSIYVSSWNVRSRTSQIGRRMERRVVSRPPLIKGLEFDHSIVLDADALNAKELYVAMTRGTKSLTVISQGPIIQKPSPFGVA
jgi:AAA domain-containing protein